MRSLPSLRSAVAGFVLAAAVLAPRAAAAAGASPVDATPAQKKEATEHFTAGKQAVDAKNWERAILELRASLQVVDSPNARLVLARALRDSGDLAGAWSEYAQVIADATKLASSEPRYAQTSDAATTERADLEPKLAFVTVTVAHAPADATLKVGGRAVAAPDWTSPIVVSAGAVDVVL